MIRRCSLNGIRTRAAIVRGEILNIRPCGSTSGVVWLEIFLKMATMIRHHGDKGACVDAAAAADDDDDDEDS